MLWIHLGFGHLLLVLCIFMSNTAYKSPLAQVSKDILYVANEILIGLYKKRVFILRWILTMKCCKDAFHAVLGFSKESLNLR